MGDPTATIFVEDSQLLSLLHTATLKVWKRVDLSVMKKTFAYHFLPSRGRYRLWPSMQSIGHPSPCFFYPLSQLLSNSQTSTRVSLTMSEVATCSNSFPTQAHKEHESFLLTTSPSGISLSDSFISSDLVVSDMDNRYFVPTEDIRADNPKKFDQRREAWADAEIDPGVSLSYWTLDRVTVEQINHQDAMNQTWSMICTYHFR